MGAFIAAQRGNHSMSDFRKARESLCAGQRVSCTFPGETGDSAQSSLECQCDLCKAMPDPAGTRAPDKESGPVC